MEVKIVVDETKFKDVLENELEAFSKEEIHEIIRDCIIDTFKNPEFIERIFIHKDYWGNSSPSGLLENAVKNNKAGRFGHAVSEPGVSSVLLFYPQKHFAEMRH